MRQIMVYIFREACFDSSFEPFLIFTDFRKKGVVSWGGNLESDLIDSLILGKLK